MATELLHGHIPYARLASALDTLRQWRLAPEVAFQGPELDGLDEKELLDAGQRLAASGLEVTVHAPFFDLNPGSPEPLVVEATRRRCRQTLAAARALGARLAVFHPGYEHWRYGGRSERWLEKSLAFWPPLIEEAAAQGCLLALENIFERAPDTLQALLEGLDSPWLGHCFDVGHWRLFSRVGLEEWFDALGSRTLHLHLHDNHGQSDAHLPVGEGDIDFAALLRLRRTLAPQASMTLEAHSPEALSRSLAALRRLLAN